MEVVQAVLEAKVSSVVTYMAANCMVLNKEKTQVLWIGSGLTTSVVNIGNSLVPPVESIEVLGVKFNRSLKSDPHIAALTSAANSYKGVARQLEALNFPNYF